MSRLTCSMMPRKLLHFVYRLLRQASGARFNGISSHGSHCSCSRIQELFEIDLSELEKVATQLDKGDEQRRDFKGIYAECAAVLRQARAFSTLAVYSSFFWGRDFGHTPATLCSSSVMQKKRRNFHSQASILAEKHSNPNYNICHYIALNVEHTSIGAMADQERRGRDQNAA